jgi:transglutaminase-like putative cysteine protease
MVVEHVETVIHMLADCTGYREHTLVARLQSDAAVKKYSVITLPYASSSEHIELAYARVRHPDGTAADTKSSDGIDMPSAVTQRAPFYSDRKELQLPLRGLTVGDTLELKYRIVRTKPEIPNQFWGQENLADSAVVLSSSVELRVPSGMYVKVWSPSLTPVESNTAAKADAPAQHVYKWTWAQLKPTVGKEAEAEAAARKKLLWTTDQELDAKQGRLPTIAWTTFKSWEEVGAWYRSLEADRIIPDDTVKAKAAELTAGKSTTEAKVQALYTYVATNVRYIGVAFGIGRYQPHTASEILSNQYGDCKDKHTLLAAMLAASGIQSTAALVGVGIRFNQDVPSPASFNHLITQLTLDGKPLWLDTTAEVAPFGMLTATTRDKQTLVIPGAAAASIARTPADPLIADATAMKSVGSLDEKGVFSSHVLLSFRGDGEIAVRSLFRQIPATQYNQAVQMFSKTVGLTGTASNADVSPPKDTTQTFKLGYDYMREKAGDWEHLRVIAEVLPVVLPRVTDLEPPVRAIQLGIPRTLGSTSSMKLPESWSARMPADVHATCPYGTYDMTFHLDGGTLNVERHLVVLAKEVPVSDWKTYQVWVNKVNPGREPYIQLLTASAVKASEARTKQIEDALNSSDPMVKGSVAYGLAGSNTHLTDAQTLAEQAVQLEEEIASKAVTMEDKVRSFDQMQSLGTVWETIGVVYYRQRQYDKAETYMHAAWELKPRNVNINMYMGLICEALNKPEDAKIFYRITLSGTESYAVKGSIQSRLSRLGASTGDPLPMDVTTPLPTLMLHLDPSGAEPWVDILLSREKRPVVSLLKGDPAIETPLVEAIQIALADHLPDRGPEKLLRRARLICPPSEKPGCTLHFIGSQVAMEAAATFTGVNASH